MHLRSIRLPRSTRGIIGLLILPGLLFRHAREDNAEAESELFDDDVFRYDVQPVELVQLTWNLTKKTVTAGGSPAVGHVPLGLQSRPAKAKKPGGVLLETLSVQRGAKALTSNREMAAAVALITCSVVLILALVACICFANLQKEQAEEEEFSRRGSRASSASAEDVVERTAPRHGGTTLLFGSEGSQATPMEPDNNDIDLNEDIYSIVLQGILCDGVALLEGSARHKSTMAVHRFRMIAVLVLLCANYFLQFGILWFMSSYVVSPAIADVQSVYRHFRENCFMQNGDVNQSGCHNYSDIHRLCGLVFTYTWFMLLILMLWTMSMVREFRDTERLSRVLWNIASTTHFEKMIEYNHGVEHVTHLTPTFRFVIFLVVTVPKIAITAILGCLGTVWLASTSDLSEVVLNAVALEFIVKIDELLFDAVVPVTARQDLNKFKLTLTQKHKPGTFNVDVWLGYFSSLVYLLLIVAVPPIFITIGQSLPFLNVFPGYDRGEVEQVCTPYLAEHRQRVCIYGSVCFPYGR